jgi:zinc transporter ZupT
MILTLGIPLFAIVLGGLIIELGAYKISTFKQHLLGFSGSFLLSITLIELLPNLFEQHKEPRLISLIILGGILLQMVLESFSKGAEHGHTHLNESDGFPGFALIFSALCVHAFIEGMPLGYEKHLLLAVSLHKVPIAMILYTLALNANLTKTQAFGSLILFGLITPLGSLFTHLDWVIAYTPYLNALSAGIFLHVGAIILFESEKGHRFNLARIVMVLLGMLLAYLIG